MAFWNPLADPIDFFTLSGLRSPGVAELSGATSPRKWEERGGYGLSGATVVFRGVGLCYFTFRLKLYTETDWDDWLSWKSLVNRPPFGTRPKAHDIWHPFLDQLGVTAAVVEEVTQPEQGESGEWTVSIKFIEFRKPVVALAKPVAAKATTADPVEADMIAPLMAEFNRLLSPAPPPPPPPPGAMSLPPPTPPLPRLP
jgi:hypothetical protein